jgi:probable F420-dependent oxidoreductase
VTDTTRFSLQAYWMPEAWYPRVALEAERAGFDGFWIGDHVAAPIRYAPAYRYRASGRPTMVPKTPLVDTFGALTAAAAVTGRISIGTNVAVVAMRPPLLTARAALTAQNLSGGRFRLGIGVGWMREEFAALGMPFENRGARTDEIIALLRRLWTGEEIAHDGPTCAFAELRLWPPAVAPIPILGSGTAKPALRRSARLDGWCGPPGLLLEQTIAIRESLEAQRLCAGKNDEPFELWVHPGQGSPAEIAVYRNAGFRNLVLTPAYAATPSTIDEARDGVHAAADAAGLSTVR